MSPKTSLPEAKPVTGSLVVGNRRSMTNGYAPRAAAPQAGGDPFVILHAIRRHCVLAAIIGGILGVPAAIGAWMVMVPQAEAEAFLQINSSETPLVFETADRKNATALKGLVFKNTQLQLIQTPVVLSSAIASPPVQEILPLEGVPNPLGLISEELEISFPDDGEIMRVSLRAPEGKAATVLLDAVVQSYLQEAVLSERQARMARMANLEQAHADTEETVRAKRANMRDLVETLGTGDLESLSLAQQTTVERYSTMQQELSRVTFELMRTEGELEILKKTAAVEAAAPKEENAPAPVEIAIDPIEFEKLVTSDATMISLIERQRRLSARIDQLNSQLGEKGAASRTTALAEELGQVESDITSRQAALEEHMLGKLKKEAEQQKQTGVAEGTDVHSKLEMLSMTANVLKTQKETLAKDVKAAEDLAKTIGRSSIDVEMMRSEISSQEQIRTGLSEEIERTRIELKAEPRIKLISPASIKSNSDGKKRIASAGGAGLFGFVLPFLLFIAADLRRGTVGDSGSLKNNLKLEVLGTVPQVRRLPNGKGLAQKRLPGAEHAYMESVNSVSASLLRNQSVEGHSIVMVTSAEQGEGKSSLARSLWYSLTHTGHSVVLVDLDLCSPTLHTRLHVERENGILEYLSGEATIDDVMRVDDHGRRFITAGRPESNRLSYLTRPRLSRMVSDLRATADIVIIDSAPLLPVADSRMIGEWVDSVVIATIKDRSRMPQLQTMLDLCRAHDLNIAGLVFMGERHSKLPKYYAVT